MENTLEERLNAHLHVRVSRQLVAETKRIGLAERDQARNTSRFRVASGVVLTVALLAGGGAVAYANPQSWSWLFPPVVSREFTFPGDLNCVARITAGPNFSTGKPTASDMLTVVNAARNIQLNDHTVLGYLADAERDAGDFSGSAGHVAERQALMVAVQNEMVHSADAQSGATWSVSTSCE